MKKLSPIRKGVFALLLALCLGSGTAYAYNFSATYSGKTFYFNIINSTNHYVEITYPANNNVDPWGGYTKPTGNITLPSSITYNGVTYYVKRIGNHAFAQCYGLTGSLTIPSSITSIGDWAFNYCYGFTGSLTIGSSVTTIGEGAFSYCSGFSGNLTIPSSVTTIGWAAFEECSGFSGNLTIGNSVNMIDDYAFEGCSGFSGTLTVGTNVSTIGRGAFSGCNSLTQVKFNATNCADVEDEDYPFENCTGSLIIGNNVTRVPAYMFKESYFDGTLTIGSSVTSIGSSAFYQCGFTGSLVIPNSVITIGDFAFYECYHFSSLTLGDHVTTIYNCAFCYCASANNGFSGNLIIPNSVTTIGVAAFEECYNFAGGTLTIGTGVTSIGQWAFRRCGFSQVNYNATNCADFDEGDIPFEYYTGTITISSNVQRVPAHLTKGASFSHVNFYAINCADVTSTAKPFEGCGGTLTIGSNVSKIPAYMFFDCDGFTGSLTIPNSVTTIGEHAFYDCDNFSSLSLGSSLYSIGACAFRSCSGFTGSLTIPNSVTTIGNQAFEYCWGFTGSLTIPNSVTTIGDHAFFSCSGFTGSLTLGNSLTLITRYAFCGCSGFTGSLTIPSSVTTIGEYAFYGCSGFTGSLTIGTGVTTIGTSAFYNCSGLTGSLNLPNSLTTINNYVFYNCNGLTGSLNLPSSLTSIGNYAFYHCTGFTGSLSIPISVTSIGNYAFNGCTGFTGSLNLGNSVVTIGEYAFDGCTGFTGSLTIPSTLTSIGQRAFRYCSGLTSMTVLPETPPTLGTNVFYNVPKTIPVYVPCGTLSTYQSTSGWSAFTNMQEYCDPLTYSINPDGVSVTVMGHVDGTDATGPLIIPETKTINGVTYAVSTIGYGAFYNCSGLTGSLTIPNSVTEIEDWAFGQCTGFTGSLTIGNSVTTIGDYAFYDCSGLTGSLTIPNSVTTIGDIAFCDCTGFTGSLTIPNSVTEIGSYAFAWCIGFTGSLVIPNSVTSIGVSAFHYCYGFTGTLTLGNSVTTIAPWAFCYCSGFTGSLTIPNSVTMIGEEAFGGDVGFNGTLTIGTGVTSIGTSAFQGCSGFTQVKFNATNCAGVTYEDKPFEGCGGTLTIGSNVTRIPAYMFYNCSGFTGSLSIPNSVTEIDDWAFGQCTGFTGSLTIGNSVTTIGSSAFYYCTGLTGSLTIPNSVTTIGDNAFNDCSGLTGSLTILNSVTEIGSYAFAWCTGFTGSLTIPNSVRVIDPCAFYACPFTGTLTIGSNVTTIGTYAFAYCSSLTSMTVLPEIPPTLGAEAFKYVPTTIPMYVPCSSLDDYQSASGWSAFTNYQCNPSVTVTAVPTQGGTVTGGGTYTYGTSCTVTATPSSGYQFMHWSKNGTVVSCNASYTFTATQDVDLEAVFIRQWYLGDIIGNGTNASEYLPSHSYYRYSLSEQIYTASEMGGSTTINTISFFNAGTTKTRTYDIYMKHTTKTSFSSSTDWISVTSSNKVFSGSVTMRAGMWTTIELDTPFAYNGTSNLLLVVDDNTGSYSSGMMCRTYATSGNQAIRIYSDGTNYNPSSPSSYTGTCMTEKNQIMLNRWAYDITATSANTSAGTVSGGGRYGDGDLCRLKATAKSGYVFMAWKDESDVVVSTDANYSFIVTEDRILTADFCSDEDHCYLTFNLYDSWGDGWNGNQLVVNYPNGMSEKLTVPSGDEATFTLPVPDGAYMELGWIAGGYIYECSFDVRYSDGSMLYTGLNLDENFEYGFEMDCAGESGQWIYIGDHSTANNYYLPSWSYYCYGLSEQIYTAEEIGTAGIINGIAFYNEGTQTRTRNYSIYLKTTEKTAFASQTDWVSASNATLVYSGSVTMESGTWTPIIFDTPFEYDDSFNLVLIVDDNTGTYTNSPYMSCRVFNADGLQTLRVYSDGTDYNPNSPSGYTGVLQSVKNQIMLDMLPPCNEPSDLNVTNITTTSADINWTSIYNSIELQYRKMSSQNYDFEDGLGDWTTIDADGDGYGWYQDNSNYGHESFGSVHSASYDGVALSPDNYLVSPQITLGGSITFWASAYSSSYPSEHFGVAVSEDGINFTMVQEWTMTAKGEGSKAGRSRDGGNRIQGNWYQYTADLSAYSGLGYVAIRHFNCYDEWRLIVDDITIAQPNSAWICFGCDTCPYTLTNLLPGTQYQVRVRSNCVEDYYSDWACTMFTTQAPPTVTQTVSLSAGWSWWSTYIDADDLLNQLKASLGTNGMSINTQGAVLVYRNGMWMGGMSSIENKKGYKIKTNAPVEVTIEGQIVDPSTCPITITEGANWIGYPLPVSQTVGNALSGFTPSNGDVIMTQGGTTVYRSGHWMPATFTFEPGKAYIYKSTSSETKTLIFSNGE